MKGLSSSVIEGVGGKRVVAMAARFALLNKVFEHFFHLLASKYNKYRGLRVDARLIGLTFYIEKLQSHLFLFRV